MSLSMLTTGGWVWLWLTLTVTLSQMGQPYKTRERGAEMVVAVMWCWLLWLVSP